MYFLHRLEAQRFPFLLGGAFIEATGRVTGWLGVGSFPFLLGGAFIEAPRTAHHGSALFSNFPSFLEGLSLRRVFVPWAAH